MFAETTKMELCDIIEQAQKTSTSSTSRSIICKNALILAPMVRICTLAFRTLCALHGADVVFTEEIVAAKLAHSEREVVFYPTVEEPIAEYVVYEKYRHAHKRTVVFATLARQESNLCTKYCSVDERHSIVEINGTNENYKHEREETSSDNILCNNNNNEIKLQRVPVILQLGVSDPQIASDAIQRCGKDVDGVDLNMGCPKKFSVRNGFGAVLMNKPEIAGNILRAMQNALLSSHKNEVREPFLSSASDKTSNVITNNVGKHQSNDLINTESASCFVSFKTRLKCTALETAEMLRTVLLHAQHSRESKCVHAITIHAREREQHSSETPQYDKAAQTIRLCRASSLFDNIIFILNGSIASRDDALSKCRRWGFDAAMMARGAMWDVTQFATSLILSQPMESETNETTTNINSNRCKEYNEAHYMSILKEIFIFSIRYRTPFVNFKYHLTRSIPELPVLKPLMKTVQQELLSYADCFDFFNCTNDEVTWLQKCLLDLHTINDEKKEEKGNSCLFSADDVSSNTSLKRVKTDNVM